MTGGPAPGPRQSPPPPLPYLDWGRGQIFPSSFFARIEDFTVAEWQSLTGVIAPRPRLPPTDFP